MKLLIVIPDYCITDLAIECLRSLEGACSAFPARGWPSARRDGQRRSAAAPRCDRRERVVSGSIRHCTRIMAITGGNNLVIRAALASSDPPEYVLLLNADTIVQDGALEELVAFMDGHPRAGIAGSRLLSPEGEIKARRIAS